MGADCKSAGYAYAGSNPARPIRLRTKFWVYDTRISQNLESIVPEIVRPCSSVVEHFIGNEEVMSSILIMGFLSWNLLSG